MKVLVGYHGKGNFGDDIILDEYLNSHVNDNFILYLYKDDNSNKKFPSNVRLRYWSKSKLSNIFSFIKNLLRCNQVVWVGGTCFSEQDGIGGYNFMSLALFFRKEIGYEYIGINKLVDVNNIKKAKFLLENATRIIVRDSISQHNLKNIVGYDIESELSVDLGEIYLLKKMEKYNNKDHKITENKVVLAWRDLGNYYSSEQIANLNLGLCAYLQEITKFDGEIVIFNADESIDSLTSVQLINILENISPSCKVTYYPKITNDDKIRLLLSSSQIITSRLHVAIAGSIFNKKTVILNYSQKIENLSGQYSYEVVEPEFFQGYYE